MKEFFKKIGTGLKKIFDKIVGFVKKHKVAIVSTITAAASAYMGYRVGEFVGENTSFEKFEGDLIDFAKDANTRGKIIAKEIDGGTVQMRFVPSE